MKRLLLIAVPLSLVTLVGCDGCSRTEAPPTTGEPVAEGTSSLPLEGTGEAAAQLEAETASAAATVNDETVITIAGMQVQLDELVERYERIEGRPPTTPEWRNERRRRIVQEAVYTTLVATHVAEQNVDVPDDLLASTLLADLRHVYADPSLYERYLLSRETTRETFEAERRQQLAVDLALGGDEELNPSEEEIRTFYDENRENWREDDRVLLSTLTVRVRPNSTDEVVEEARVRIAALSDLIAEGQEFGAVAGEHSEASERFQSGDLGWVPRGRRAQLASVEGVLFSAPVDSVTEALRTQLGWQLFWIRDRRDAGVREFDEVQQVLADPLRRRNRQTARQQLVNTLLESADVQYHEDRWGME
ncbi:MAG: hypothetical protein ACI81R_001236 [Bradymonadia bacterium]|jgi:hypothetical protein